MQRRFFFMVSIDLLLRRLEMSELIPVSFFVVCVSRGAEVTAPPLSFP